MAIPNNILQQVETYAESGLAYLENLNCFISTLNTKFKNFQDETANLGDTINISLPTRAVVTNGLVASFQGVQQRLHPIICDQAANVSHAFTDQQFIFNAEQYMDEFGKARMVELSAAIEANVALNAVSGVPVYEIVNGQSVPTGALHTESGPYRFYGDGVTALSSFQQLADAAAIFRNYGAANGPLKFYLDDKSPVQIAGSGLGQFVPNRNEEIANSWDLGTYKGSNSMFYSSNLLPIHVAGTAGENQDTLTLVSTNDPTGVAITQLTFSGVTVNSGAFKAGDLIQFDLSTGLVYLTFTGHKPSRNLVQVRVLADADATGGSVTVNITPTLSSAYGPNQNLNKALGAGATAKALPSHRGALIVGGEAFYLAMPSLPSTSPFVSSTAQDADTGVSMRTYYGHQFGLNQYGLVNDCIWAATCVPEYSMRLVLPPS